MFTRRVRELVARTKPYMRWIWFHKRNYTWKSWHFLRGATTTTRYTSWNRQGAPSIDLYNKQTVLIFLGHLWVVFLFYYYYYSRFSGSVCRSFGPDWCHICRFCPKLVVVHEVGGGGSTGVVAACATARKRSVRQQWRWQHRSGHLTPPRWWWWFFNGRLWPWDRWPRSKRRPAAC